MVGPLVLLLVLLTAGGRKELVTADDGKPQETADDWTELGCRDGEGKLVDWYVLYKLPELNDTGVPLVDQGLGYLYYSSATTGNKFFLSDVSINDPSSFPGQTLKPIYDDPTRDSFTYAFYNDVHPDGTTDSLRGHTKGVVAFDDQTGFWMVHSVPGFPPAQYSATVQRPKMIRTIENIWELPTVSPGWPDEYSYPESGKPLGQSFLCVTLPSSELEKVAYQMKYIDPFFYATKLSPYSGYYMTDYILNGGRNPVAPWYSVKHLETNDMDIISFAKTSKFGKDLYNGLVKQYMPNDTFVATETALGPINNSYRLPTNCSTRPILINVQKIQIFADKGIFSFNNLNDNSKWARANPWVCIGDMDRVKAQRRRSGGTVCLNSPQLHSVYWGLVAMKEHGYEWCNRPWNG